jgi:hypothetical protein
MIWPQIIYAAWCVFWAYANHRGITFANVWILHGINGLLHGSIWYGMGLMAGNWELLAVMPFIGKSFFDVPLSLFRGKPLNYIPENPRSILDKVEKKVFFNDAIFAKSFYVAAIASLNIYFYYGN